MHKKRTRSSETKKGILEVLIVNAKGIRHTNLIGTPSYFVVTQCGTKVYTSKVSSENDEVVRWNEKFKFEFPLRDWKYLSHLKFRIMDLEFFSDGGFVGETRIYLGGIISEGIRKGILQVKPAPYNVVLDDDTYKGEIKIGLKFLTNKSSQQQERTASFALENQPATQSFYGFLINLLKNLWSKFMAN
ncbi:Calcium-dependent lipid-binding (CaLB domain) family protein [Euphorbia peplus]|nr:Calcium-dependent lipid-binding (CaLB domain) family protein [Euphorbia peplus]